MLFFSVPKLLLLYSLVDEKEPNISAIVAEISFLFENSSEVREKLTTVLEVREIDTGTTCSSFLALHQLSTAILCYLLLSSSPSSL